jgi:hypothetical protein
MAPEQLAGATATVATDVWAMGAVLYRCVSGQAPYAGASSSEVFGKLARDLAEPLSASGFPPGFCAAIDRALARNPRHRYGSMGEFAAALVLTAREAGFDVPTALETSAGMKGIDWEVILGARTKSNTSNGARRRAWNAWSLGLAVATLAVAAWAGLGRSGRSVNLARRPVEAAGLRFSRDEASRVSEAVALKPKLGGVGPAPAAPVVTAVVHGAGRPPESPNRPKRPQLPRRPAPAGPAEAAYSAAELPVAIEW